MPYRSATKRVNHQARSYASVRVGPSVSRSASDGSLAISAARPGPGSGAAGRADEVGDAFGQPPGCVCRRISAGRVVKELMAQHNSQCGIAHRSGPRREDDAPAGGRCGDVGAAARQGAELLIGRGGHDDDVAGPVGTPEPRHGPNGVVHGAGHALQQRLRCRTTQAHQLHRATIRRRLGARSHRSRGGRRRWGRNWMRRVRPADKRSPPRSTRRSAAGPETDV